MKITKFAGEHRFLSNFYPAQVMFDGWMYPTVEHAYQAAKTTNTRQRLWIRMAPTPGIAKKRGRELELRPDWENMKVAVMAYLLIEKFGHHELRMQLLATGDAELIEGNTWGDKYWGQCDGEGENWLGKLLMQVRSSLQS